MPTYGIHFTIIRDGKLRTKNIAVDAPSMNAAVEKVKAKYGRIKIWQAGRIEKLPGGFWVWLKDD